MSQPLIHLVCGSTGAGKTTYARRLTDEIGAVLFSIDEWMTTLFWMDTPRPLVPAWSMARVERCNAQIWQTARAVAGLGVPCVLDLGFSSAEQRARSLQQAADAGLSARLHYVDVASDERWRRVQVRNEQKVQTRQLPFDVTREMFEFVEGLFEPPTNEELDAADGIHVRG